MKDLKIYEEQCPSFGIALKNTEVGYFPKPQNKSEIQTYFPCEFELNIEGVQKSGKLIIDNLQKIVFVYFERYWSTCEFVDVTHLFNIIK